MVTERPAHSNSIVQAAPLWRQLFDAALAVAGPVALARRLGYSNHTLVCRIARGHIPASPKFRARVIAAYHIVRCPHTGTDQPRADCQRSHAAPPTHNPGAMAHWRACQRCPHKPGAHP